MKEYAAQDLRLPRRKPRHLWLSLRYRLYRRSLSVLPRKWLLKRWLNAEWLSRRIGQELAAQVYGDAFVAQGGTLSAELLLSLVEPGSRVVDIGCGNGIWSRVAAQRASNVVGIDLDPRVIEEANATEVPPNVTYRVADARTAAKEDPFELGLLIHVIEHLDEPISFLRDLRPACRRLLVEVPDLEADPLNRVRLDMGIPFYYDADHVREYTAQTLLDELREAGWNGRVVAKRHRTMLVEATQA